MLNTTYIKQLIKSKYATQAAFAEKLGITPPSFSEWLEKGHIPQSRLDSFFEALEVTSQEEIEKIFNIPPFQICYRTSKVTQEKEIDDSIRQRASMIGKVFLAIGNKKPESELLLSIRNSLKEITDPYEAARKIREHFDVNEKTPFVINSSPITYILRNCHINVLCLPFSSLGVNSKGGVNPLAFTAVKNNQYFVLCDSNRTLDENAFDSTHELVHILTGKLHENDRTLETFIDRVAEELVYPKAFLEREFPFIVDKKILKQDDFNITKLESLFGNYSTMSPRGLAKTLVNLGHIKKNLDVYSWLHDEYHDDFCKRFGFTATSIGKMNFDFSDSYAFEEFMNRFVEADPFRYPLFVDLKKALVEDRITHRAFADLFLMDSGDVDELRLKWKQELNANNPIGS